MGRCHLHDPRTVARTKTVFPQYGVNVMISGMIRYRDGRIVIPDAGKPEIRWRQA